MTTKTELKQSAAALKKAALKTGAKANSRLIKQADALLKAAESALTDGVIGPEVQTKIDNMHDGINKAMSSLSSTSGEAADKAIDAASKLLDDSLGLADDVANAPKMAQKIGAIFGSAARTTVDSTAAAAEAVADTAVDVNEGLKQGFEREGDVPVNNDQRRFLDEARNGANAPAPEEVKPVRQRMMDAVAGLGAKVKGLGTKAEAPSQVEVDKRRTEVEDFLAKRNNGKRPTNKQVDRVLNASGGLPDVAAAEAPELQAARKMADDLGLKNPSDKELRKLYKATEGVKLPNRADPGNVVGRTLRTATDVKGIAKKLTPLAGATAMGDMFNGVAIRMGEGMTMSDAVSDGLIDTGISMRELGEALVNDPSGTAGAMWDSFSVAGMAEDVVGTLVKGAWNLTVGTVKSGANALDSDAADGLAFMDPGADGIKMLPSDSELSKRMAQEEEVRGRLVQAKISGDEGAIASITAEQTANRAANSNADNSFIYDASDSVEAATVSTGAALDIGAEEGVAPAGLAGAAANGVTEVINNEASQPIYMNAAGDAFADEANIETLSGGAAAALPKSIDSIISGDSRGVAGLNISAAAQAGYAKALGVTKAAGGPVSADSLQRKIQVDNELLSATTDPDMRDRIQASIDNDNSSLVSMTRGLAGQKPSTALQIRKGNVSDAQLGAETAGTLINAGAGNTTDQTVYNTSLAEQASGGFTDGLFGRDTPDPSKQVVQVNQQDHDFVPFIDKTTNLTYSDGTAGTYENLDLSQQQILANQAAANKRRLGLAQ